MKQQGQGQGQEMGTLAQGNSAEVRRKGVQVGWVCGQAIGRCLQLSWRRRVLLQHVSPLTNQSISQPITA